MWDTPGGAKPKGRIGCMALFNLLLPVHCPFSRIQKVRVFIALRMKDREGPNQAVHPPKFMAMFTSSGLLFSPVDTLCPWKQMEALGSVEFGLCQYPSKVDLQICEGSVRLSVSG